jgi:hypothetical protein
MRITNFLKLAVAATLLGGGTMAVFATPTGPAAPGYYTIGHVEPGTPAEVNDEMGYLNTLLGLYNTYQTTGTAPNPPHDDRVYTVTIGDPSGVPAPPLPLATWNSIGDKFSDPVTTISVDVTGFTYLSIKWGDDTVFYYVAGSGEITVPVPDFENSVNGKGASHYNLFGVDEVEISVPDGGSTLALIGLSLTVLGCIRRKTR